MNRRFINIAAIMIVVILNIATLPDSHALASDPCPVPQVALSDTPADLAKIQSDIDRYALCVERAQLLQRLNDLALENGYGLPSGTTHLSPGLSLDAGQHGIDSDELVQEHSRKLGPDEWQVLEIYGTMNNLQAKLIKDGILTQVRTGEKLPDGKTISKIAPTQVVVLEEGVSASLDWVE